MKYMVIETFKPGMAGKIYERYEAIGRMLPDGLVYIDSWLALDNHKCFQLMETDDEKLFDVWIAEWDDCIDFQIIPVQDSPTRHTK